ncbi:unnamed protein product [Lepidochelys kempii]
MPFVSEELFQRLPRRGPPRPPPASASPPTPAPSSSAGGTGAWRARWSSRWASSAPCAPLRADYNLTRTRADCFLQCPDSGAADAASRCSPYIRSLSSSGRVRVLGPGEAPPAGCAVAVASDKCTVHLLLKGLIDAEKEISKLAGKQGELQKQIERLQERMETPDYGTKVPPKVQEADAAKLQQSRTELQKVMEAVETFQRMI